MHVFEELAVTTVTSVLPLLSVTLLLLKWASHALSLLSFIGRTLFCLTLGTVQPLHFHPPHCCSYCAKKEYQLKTATTLISHSRELHPTLISTFKQGEVLTNPTWWLQNEKGKMQTLTAVRQHSSHWPEKMITFLQVNHWSINGCIASIITESYCRPVLFNMKGRVGWCSCSTLIISAT